jgi:DNA primase
VNDSPLSLAPSEVAAYYSAHIPQLKQTRTREWRGACPIHQGRALNFAVNPTSGFYFCFSQCGAGGSIYDLDLALYGGTFPAARDRVFHTIGRPVEKLTKQQKKEWAEKRRLDQEDEVWAECWHRGSLLSLEWQLELNKRGLFETEGEDLEKLAKAVRRDTRRETRLQSLSRAELLSLYRQESTADPAMASLMIRLGEDDLGDIRLEAATCVRMLEIQAAREQRSAA